MEEKEEFALKIKSEYINQNNVSTPVEFHFVNNINDRWIFYTNDLNVIYQFVNRDFSNENGLLMPFNGSCYHILIRNDYKDYQCTIIHESTHVIDYDNFRKQFNNGNKNIEFHPYYCCMALYSEFHARKVAHKYYFQNFSSNDILQEMINIVSHIKELENQMSTDKVTNIIQDLRLYELMQHLGRIYSFNIDISPLDDFSDNIKYLYACLIALDKNWNDTNFIAVETALKKLYKK